MAFWVELRCDLNATPECYDATNRNPKDWVRTWAMRRDLKALEVEATRLGWRWLEDRWACPACAKAAKPV